MEAVKLADAKAHFSELVDRAQAGETIDIIRRGKLAARLVPPEKQLKPIDVEALKSFTDGLTPQRQSAGDLVREMRESDRY